MSMKRNFSCLMLLVMLLFGASESIHSMVAIGSKAATAVGRKALVGVVKSSADDAFRAAFKGALNVSDDMIRAGIAQLDDVSRMALLQGTKLSDDMVANLAKTFNSSVDDIGGVAFTKGAAGSSADDILAASLKTSSGLSDDAARAVVNQMDDATKAALMNGDEALSGIKTAFGKASKAGTALLDDTGKVMASLGDDVGSKMSAQLDTLAKNVDSLGGLGDDLGNVAKLAGISDDIMTKSVKQMEGMLKQIDGLSTVQSKNILGKFKGAKGIFKRAADGFDEATTFLGKKGTGVLSSADDALARSYDDMISGRVAGNLSPAEAAKQLKKLKWVNKTRGQQMFSITKFGAGRGLTIVKYVGGVLGAAVLFMIPALFQSSFVAEQHQNAMLQTYIPPVKFGDVVVQLPDSVVNMGDASQSQFVYYGIPVENPGDKVSDAAKAAYPGVSGATTKNKVSRGVSNGYAQAFTAAKKISIPRYNLSAKALSTLPLYVSYSEQSWEEWGASGIPDAAFSQTLINLDTGHIFYADGSSVDGPSAPLVGPPTHGKTVQSFLPKKLGHLQTAGMHHTYTEYADTQDAASAGKVSSPLMRRFDCSCLKENEGILSADTVGLCTDTKAPTCLLTSALNQLSAGLVLNADGQVMRPDQDEATEIKKGALGKVIPIQGLGKKFNSVLEMFPGAQQDALANSGMLTVSITADMSVPDAIKIQGAQPDNYSAKGVYVYQCKNTPLARVLKSQSGGQETKNYNEQITDFIVFLDKDLNQVPMMAPVSDPNNYHFAKMGLNPEVKYVSTIVGDFDENGNFVFLPQLNIQSPPSLVAKGLPPSFAPLYGLKAQKGSLAINYNQNLSSVVGAASQALIGHGKLGQQFQHMQSAMLGLLSQGPFGKYKLGPVESSMQPRIGGVSLMLYTGFNGYPVSQDQANANCTDVLIPLSAQGKTVTLPSDNVAQYYGLVSDLTYSVYPDGTITVDPDGFEDSPLSPSWAIDSAKENEFYWLDKLTEMGLGGDPNFTMPPDLINFVKTARAAWVNWVRIVGSSTLLKQEFTGIAVPGTENVFTIVSQQALVNGLYIYNCTPSPSNLEQDSFVLINSASPQPADPTLGTMSASTATAATNMLSIVSGLLYDASGRQVKNASGAGYSVDVSVLLKALNASNPKGFSNDFKANLNVSTAKAATEAEELVYPFSFGGLQLGVYQADLNTDTYLYVNAEGAGSSDDFETDNYFVTIDSYTNLTSAGAKLSPATAYMVSLVTGQVYGPEGVETTMDVSILSSIIGALSPSWRSGVTDKIALLKSQLAAKEQDDQKETAKMDAEPVANSGQVTVSQDAILKVIANLEGQDYLAYPYWMLKQDSVSGMYVLVSPADLEGNEFMYTFFAVPNTFTNADGDPIRVGAAFDSRGNLLRAIKGVELASMLQEYGVAVDSAGKQYLGANNQLPLMSLDPADYTLQPGQSGKSMIYSNDPDFPSYGIVSPVNGPESQFHFYYNTISKAYYVMEVKGADIRYIDTAGGNVYNLDGSSRAAANPVAMNINGDSSDMLLPYINDDTFMQCVVKNAGGNNEYSDFMNLESTFEPFVADIATNELAASNTLVADGEPYNTVNVFQMPFPDTLTAMPGINDITTYNVYWEGGSASYAVDPSYEWEDLKVLPIDMNSRALLNPLPEEKYEGARLVFRNSALHTLVFNGHLYTGAQQNGTDSYVLSLPSRLAGNPSPSGVSARVTVSVKTDTKTKVQYLEVNEENGSKVYNYQYTFLSLPSAQLDDYKNNIWQAETIANVSGKISLEKYLPIDSYGGVELSPVGINSVVNIPTDPSEKSALSAALGDVLRDTVNNRFLAPINASMFPYFTQNGFVNIDNGALFDETGMLVGYTLQIEDLMNLLKQLTISVVRNQSNQTALRYRAPSTPEVQIPVAQTYEYDVQPEVQTSAPQSYVPAQQSVAQPVAQAPEVQQSVQQMVQTPVAQQVTQQQVVQAPVAQSRVVQPASQASRVVQSVSQAPAVGVSYSSDAQIVQLQQQNAKMKQGIMKAQRKLRSTTISSRKTVYRNQVDTYNDQIDINNRKIAELREMSAASGNRSRGTLLGRLGSKIFKRKKR